MNESTMKRRVWIRNIIIIFLAALLILTLCSNSIMNRSLPEVAVQYPQYGSIASRIRASGTVASNQSYDVTIEQTRVVSSVEVRVGQRVTKGDTILRLEPGDSSEVDALKTELANLNIQLIQKLREDPSLNPNTTADDKLQSLLDQLTSARDTLADEQSSLSLLREDLAEIRSRVDAIPAYDALMNAKTSLSQAESTLEALNAEIERLNGKKGQLGGNGYYTSDEIEALIAKAENAFYEAQFAYGDAAVAYDRAATARAALEKNVDAAKKANDSAKKAVTDYESQNPGGSVTWNDVLQKQQAVSDAEAELKEAEKYYYFNDTEYNVAESNYNAAKAAYDAAYKDGKLVVTPEELAQIKENLTNAETLYKNLTAQKQALDKLKAKVTTAQQEAQAAYYKYLQSSQSNTVLTNLKQQAEAAQANYDALSERLTEAQKTEADTKDACDKAKTKMEDAESELEKTQNYRAYDEYNDQIRELTKEKEAAEKTKTDAEALIESASDENVRKVNNELTAKQREVTRQENAVSKAQRSVSDLETKVAAARNAAADSDTEKLDEKKYKIELQQIRDAIKKKTNEIALLEEKATGTTLTAPVSGTIETIAVSAGQKAQANTTLIAITLADKGYTMTCTVTSEQAAKIKTGDVATIQWYYWGETPTARVVSIKPDQASQGKNKIVTLEVTGDVTVGTSLTFTLGEKNTSYDTVIPNSAVREDSKGKFVLIVVAKSTPLGNRYTAKRVDVEVLASDDTNSAVSGALSGEYVITNSTTPISGGMQVRLSENH